jgi:hypothetical protein
MLGSLLKGGIALAVILLSLWYLYDEGQQWKDKYTTLLASSAKAAALQEQKIELERTAALKEGIAERKRYLEQLKSVLHINEQLGDKNADLKTVVTTIATERDRLRNAVASSNTIGVPKGDSSNGDTTAGGTDCDSTTTALNELMETVSLLRMACAVTTTDYNQLRREFDRNCELTGCIPQPQQQELIH